MDSGGVALRAAFDVLELLPGKLQPGYVQLERNLSDGVAYRAFQGALCGQEETRAEQPVGEHRVLHLDEEAEVVAFGLAAALARREEAGQVLLDGVREGGRQRLPVDVAVSLYIKEVALQDEVLTALRPAAFQLDIADAERPLVFRVDFQVAENELALQVVEVDVVEIRIESAAEPLALILLREPHLVRPFAIDD